LSYALTAGPIMLRMAAAHTGVQIEQMAGMPCPMHASQAQHQHPDGQSSLDGHEHCLFCQGGVGPGLVTVPAALLGPSFEPAPFAIVRTVLLAIGRHDAGYASRAPPSLT